MRLCLALEMRRLGEASRILVAYSEVLRTREPLAQECCASARTGVADSWRLRRIWVIVLRETPSASNHPVSAELITHSPARLVISRFCKRGDHSGRLGPAGD